MNIVIAGGGTGGHLFPGLALAEELRTRGHNVRFVGTARGLEARVVPASGFPLDLITVEGLKRRGAYGLLRGLGRLPQALVQSRRLLRQHHADLVVGVGGYASGPVVLMAALARLPTAILEQNSVPGITNRILGRVVDQVFATFAESAAHFPAKKLALLGNPLRAQLRAAALAAPAAPAPGSTRPQLLVLGGSQGAHRINELIAALMEGWHEQGRPLPRLVHQTGAADYAAIAARYAALGVDATLEATAFIDDMAHALLGADLIVARAGATSIAELTALGKAAVLIPFPFAADDHQRINARSLTQAGAAVVLEQDGLDAAALDRVLLPLLDDPAARRRLAEAARTLGRPDATQHIADALLALAATRSRG